MKLEEVIKELRAKRCEAIGRSDCNIVLEIINDYLIYSSTGKIFNIPTHWICDDSQ